MLPSPLDRLPLEIVGYRKVAEHLEESGAPCSEGTETSETPPLRLDAAASIHRVVVALGDVPSDEVADSVPAGLGFLRRLN